LLFTKVQGLGNDFILINCLQEPVWSGDLPGLARRACDRRFGIGADGLVLLLPSDKADVGMRIFNPDGSEAEMCGNAVRCAARFLYERGIVCRKEVRVETLAGVMKPVLLFEGNRVAAVRVDMGEPHLERSEIPMTGPPGRVLNEPLVLDGSTWHVTGVSMGNPHCVIFVPDIEKVPLAEIGPRLETHPSFPQRTNVEFVEAVNPAQVRMKVWERGAGETMACGTGACAAAVAGALNGFTGRTVTVRLAAGDLLIEWAKDDHVYMTGPAEEVFTGNWPEGR